MRTIILALLLFSSQHLVGQGKWSIEPRIDFDRYTSYKGTINNKYPITMYLTESYEPCNKNFSRWTPRKVYGWYMYDKIGKKIPLVGHACYADACESFIELFVPEDFIDYSFDENCNLQGAKEVFRQERNGDPTRFEWQMKNGQKYPVDLNPIHTFSWSTKAHLILNINDVEIESFNLNELAENEYIENVEILGKNRVEKRFHLLFKYSHQSNPGSFGHGMCGGGIEEFIAHLVIDDDFKVKSFKKILLNSCINSIDNVEVFYDVNKPELGISEEMK